MFLFQISIPQKVQLSFNYHFLPRGFSSLSSWYTFTRNTRIMEENDGSVEIRHIEGCTKASYESVSSHYCYNHSRGKFYAETFNQTCHHCCATWDRNIWKDIWALHCKKPKSYMINTAKFVHKTKKNENTSFYFTGIFLCDIWSLMVKFFPLATNSKFWFLSQVVGSIAWLQPRLDCHFKWFRHP